MTRQAHVIGNGVSNEYVQAMEEIRDLEAFAAVVYSSPSELEGVNAIVGGTGKEGLGIGTGTRGDASGDEGLKKMGGASGAGAGGGGVVDKATGVFENVWGRVVRRG